MAEVRSTIVCPACGHRESEIIPEDACRYFYQCNGCRVVLKPKKGDCCVFCSYGDVKCPSAQRNAECCRAHQPLGSLLAQTARDLIQHKLCIVSE